jgi:surfeit locus 1 family protein
MESSPMSAPEGPVFGGGRRFRPSLWSSVFAAIGVVVLIALGTWQLDRREWKEDLIARLQARSAAPPISLQTATEDPQAAEYRRLRLSGRYLHAKTLYLSSKTHEGRVGLHVVTPFDVRGGPTILVDRGWTPPELKAPEARPESVVEGETSVEGVVRLGGWRGSEWFRPDNEPAAGVWLYLDPAAMAEAVGLDDPLTAFYVSAAADQHPGRYPIGGQSQVRQRNQHLQYAITWYALALGLAGVWLAFSFRRTGADDDATGGAPS